MSAGAMVAGGLAFTIPGIWMLGHAAEVSWWQMLVVALAGVALGLLCTVLLRRHFVEKAGLPFPIGAAAAQTLKAGSTGGRMGARLFGALGFAGVYTFLRDGLGLLPAMLLNNLAIPGVAFGIYNSPMLLAVGFLVGIGAVVAWFVGAVFGNFGVVFGASSLGWWSLGEGQGICASLGMGMMMGAGVGVILRIVLPRIPQPFGRPPRQATAPGGGEAAAAEESPTFSTPYSRRTTAALATLIMAAVALLLCFALELGPLVSLVVVALVWVTTAMSSQSVGQTGIDPMEIFGLIVLLVVATFASATLVQLFFVAGIVAVACGLAGDVMNDFKAGHVLGTNPRAQWLGQAIGAVIGAVVAVFVMVVLLGAYGPGAFGPEGSFVAAQASIVATMISGIPSVEAFAVGLALGLVLSVLGLPAMMFGLGIYLPFYLSFSAFLGAMAKVLYDFVCKRRRRAASGGGNGSGSESGEVARHREALAARRGETPAPQHEAALSDGSPEGRESPRQGAAASSELEKCEAAQAETGLVVASGLLGGESVVGVLVALAAVLSGLGG
jgi:uncharacterized oligopeptide transporter (OPT) family protein